MRATRNKIVKIAAILGALPGCVKNIRDGVSRCYDAVMVEKSPIPTVAASEFVGDSTPILLKGWTASDGNVSVEELAILCALASRINARHLVEIGTFDGNTTHHLALNTPDDAKIFTLDLPFGEDAKPQNDEHDRKYIASATRERRRFCGTAVEHKIIQVYGNSMGYDFNRFVVDRKADLIFIDAGHSYECVRNDSQKSLSILADNGMIIWHDYGTCWPGVYNYLVELSRTRKLCHIAGTALAVYRAGA